MLQKQRIARRERRGVALISALFATLVAMGLIAMVASLAHSTNERADLEHDKAEARFLAIGALEVARKEIQLAIANGAAPEAAGSTYVGGQVVPYEIAPSGLEIVREDGAGVRTIVMGFDVSARATERGAVTEVRRTIHCEATPLFQFAAFYEGDLEFFPGPSATLRGRIHTNGDLHLGCGDTLTLDSNYVRAVGGMFRHRIDAPGDSPGSVMIRRWVENPFDPLEPLVLEQMQSEDQMTALGIPSESGFDSNFDAGFDFNGDGDLDDLFDWRPWAAAALERWSPPPAYSGGEGQTVASGEHGLTRSVVPELGSIEMFRESPDGNFAWDDDSQTYIAVPPGEGTHRKGYFHAHGGLSLIVYADGTWDAFDADGVSIAPELADAVRVLDIYDARQAGGSGEGTRVAEIDLERLGDSPAWPANGVLYASHYGMGEGTSAKGIKLVNASTLHGPLTVVSDGSIYVQGNFNVNDEKPAAAIGDAVQLLSSAWDDSKTPGQLPPASETTYNLAFITGNHESSEGHYNGGLENLPRFHENWSGVICRISGSFVNLWVSRYATGEWRYGDDRYEAPNRQWSYDQGFNDFDGLPPMTPLTVTAYDVVTY